MVPPNLDKAVVDSPFFSINFARKKRERAHCDSETAKQREEQLYKTANEELRHLSKKCEWARVYTNCACAIVALGILLAQARPAMPCIRLVNENFKSPHRRVSGDCCGLTETVVMKGLLW